MTPTQTSVSKREKFLPYCLPWIGEEEIREVVDSLRSGWVTTGPKVNQFERQFAEFTGARHAIAVSSCTAALHVALSALDIGPGDEVILPTMTFCATANVVCHLGATPVIVDIGEQGLITADHVRRALTRRTRAIIPVHYAGQAADLDGILALAGEKGIPVVEDAAHAIGCHYKGRRIGTYGDATAFSFYATKNMTTGEGGMITTNRDDLAARMRLLALHGLSRDAWKRYTQAGSWYYEVVAAGYKCNMTDIQASLGIHQLRRLGGFITLRRQMAACYQEALADLEELELPQQLAERNHVYHIFPVRLRPECLRIDRAGFIDELRRRNIGASVHFIPLHRHPYYATRHGCDPSQYPAAERMYEGLLSLPLYPRMSAGDLDDVVTAVREIIAGNRL